ncbi:MAG: MSEP-CTERM sorting domain-containing protein [Spirochaetes bacterium GWD1_27_9]|nr:MAG: MSEP-CTERM sorting domain-containing protein [Spirochaetes bacterium GWB1_27_13]OHD38635.1 MAG: MSEP-CTERM sorting domain-containing protein [Spirochaetes bacterium GWD1_27_9]
MDNQNKQKLTVQNPLWILLSVTIPQTIFLLISFFMINIVKSQIEQKTLTNLIIIGLITISSILFYTIFALVLKILKKKLHHIFSVILIVSNIALVYVIVLITSNLPRSIPFWMFRTDDFLFYMGTFFLPSVIYGLLIGIDFFVNKDKKNNLWINFLIAILIPTTWYLSSLLFSRFVHFPDSDFFVHFVIILFIISTVLFYFFIIRAIVIFFISKSKFSPILYNILKVFFALVFPILGLLLNNLGDKLFGLSEIVSIFGDFSHRLFYILAVLNGIFLLIPNFNNFKLRFFLFLLKSLTFSYTVYFFLAFFVFLPFAIIGIIAFGLGFLILTPVVLFMIHFNELKKDIIYLKEKFNLAKILSVAIPIFLIIPSIIIIIFYVEKSNLTKTLDYIYETSYILDKKRNFNEKLFIDSIENLKKTKENSYRLPFITPIYKSVVFSNLILNDKKINYLEAIFAGTTLFKETKNIQEEKVKIKDLNYTTIYNEKEKLYHTKIDLVLKNNDSFNSEYSTKIKLPLSSWVGDYYLVVGDKKKKALLVEKKSALWIYNEIKNQSRDPGLIYYEDLNTMSLKVFPFSRDEIRYTGFEIVHINPIKLEIDKKIVNCGDNYKNEFITDENKDFIIASSIYKKKLPIINKPIFYHFLLDHSINSRIDPNYIKNLENFIKEKNIQSNYDIYVIDSNYQKLNNTNELRSYLSKNEPKSGFWVDRVLKGLILKNYSNSNYADVFVVITNNFNNVIINTDISDFKLIYPYSDYIYHLTDDNKIYSYKIDDFNDNKQINDIISNEIVEYNYENNKYYLKNDINDSIIITDSKNDNKNIDENLLNQCVNITANYLKYSYNPDLQKKYFNDIYLASIKNRILSKLTTFIVLENEAQENLLLEKQKKILANKKYFDAGEEIDTNMSEPPILIMSLVLLLFIGFIIKRRFKIKN